MRNNNLEKTVNEVGSAYTYYLEKKINKIYARSKMSEVSLESMKKNIRNYIWNAAYKTNTGKLTKKAWFLEQVNSSQSKEELFFLCNNSITRAKSVLAH